MALFMYEAIALLRPGETLTWEIVDGRETWCGEAPAQGAGRLRPLGPRYVNQPLPDGPASAAWARAEASAAETLADLARDTGRTVDDIAERAFWDPHNPPTHIVSG